jgi:multidrug efflux pump subunit AcrA (membrane-fusion protein)
MRRLIVLSIVAAAAAALGATTAGAETLTVALRSVADEKAVFATVESISVVPARGRIGGTIVQLNVREGDPVTRGQAIATIGDEKLALQMKSLDAQIDALQAQSNQAQIDFRGSRTGGARTLPGSSSTKARTVLNVAENGLRAKTPNAPWSSNNSTKGRCWRRRQARAEETGGRWFRRVARRPRRDDSATEFR